MFASGFFDNEDRLMSRSMRLAYADVDDARSDLVRIEGQIAELRAEQIRILAWLDARKVARVEKARSMEEWTAATLDVTPATARDLVSVARSEDEVPAVRDDLSSGAITFDRAVATGALVAAGGTEHDVAESRDRDLVGVRRRTAQLKRVTRVDEEELMRQRHLSITPTLGNTAWKISGIAPGYEGHVIAKALEQVAEGFPSNRAGGSEQSRSQRMLDALTALSQDALDGLNAVDLVDPVDDDDDDDGHPIPSTDPGTPIRLVGSSVTVFLDGDRAAQSAGELGGEIAAGPRIGPDTLDRILCGGTIGLVVLDRNGKPVVSTPRSRRIPPAIRDFVLRRDGGCVMEGCRSRYRLEPHHILRYADGGTHHVDNLVTLCWHHHHVVVHRSGERIDPDSPPHRRRFLRPGERRALIEAERIAMARDIE